MTATPRLSLAMMVRDEEEFLRGALESARDIADEIVVVDTGSTDRTVEIAKDLGAEVSVFPWCDDFSAARNATLERARGEWILILDADERLRTKVDPGELRRNLPPAGAYPFQVFMLNVLNTTLGGDTLNSAYGVRIIPNDRRLGYRGRVHHNFVALDPAFPEVNASYVEEIEIVHLGYDPAVYRRRKKAERSLPLIEGMVRDHPDDLAQRYYLGREYLRVNRPGDAIGALEEAVRLMLAKPGFEQKHMLEMSYRDLIESKRASSRSIEDILRTAVAALSAFPKNADLWYVTARSLHDAGALDKAAAYYRKAIDFAGTGSEGYQRWSAAGHRRFEIYERLGSALGDLGKKSEAYAALLHALAEKPVDSEGWAELLNLLSALAIDHGDDERLPSLLDRLLARPGAPLDMFFLAVERKAQREGTAAARKMLDEAAARHNRVRASPLYSAAMHKLTALHEA